MINVVLLTNEEGECFCQKLTQLNTLHVMNSFQIKIVQSKSKLFEGHFVKKDLVERYTKTDYRSVPSSIGNYEATTPPLGVL